MIPELRIEAPWLGAPGPRAVCALLERAGRQAFFVGGCVRNALLGREATDVDVATDAHPEEVMRLAGAAGMKAVPTGIAHGTVTLAVEGGPVQVTTFRRDVATDGRRAVVAFADDIAEDAARRDLTMNALYARPDGTVVDPLGGLGDLRAGRVRFVGDAAARIAEDYLRILRFFRFHAWYGDPEAGIDAEGLAACAAARDGLTLLSRERIGAELAKLLAAPDPAPAAAAMAASGVLACVLPGADPRALPALV
nr:CCA tRNA nucleotidyltransferase [Paracoccaceae bacterium]